LAWTCGIFAFIAIRAYQRHIGGVLYKKALKKLNYGLLVIITMSILLQFGTAAIAAIYAWQLGPYVALTQLLVFAIGAGFIYVALGAKDLAKLEKVK
jgi:multisubunit Na+/H+ antiporter MnhB subunit